MESLALFVVAMTITPGPNNLMIMSSGVNFGLRRSLPHFAGICLGFPLLVIGVALGLGLVIESAPLLFELIRYAGVAYLLLMSWGLLRQALFPETAEAQAARGGKGGIDTDNHFQPWSFHRAVLFQWVNPKAWTMAVSALAAFAALDESRWEGALTVAGTYLLLGSPCVLVWMMSGLSIRQFLQSPKGRRLFNLTMAVLLLISIAPVLLSEMPGV